MTTEAKRWNTKGTTEHETARALAMAWKMLVGLLTDSQLDFRQPDGRTARERLEEIRATLNKIGW